MGQDIQTRVDVERIPNNTMTDDILQTMPDYDRTFCRECLTFYRHLGSHVAKAHKMTARAYKIRYGLDFKLSLISDEVLKKKQIAWHKDKEKYMKAGMENIRAHMFKPGHNGVRRLSTQTKNRLIAQSQDAAHQPGQCPIVRCEEHVANLPSHLYNKHRLIQIK